MESKAKALGHPIHQMLIPFPFGLLATAVIFDIVYLLWGNPTMVTVSYWMIVAGIIGAVIAAPFGLIDWLAIPKNTRAKTVGMIHGLGNVVVLFLFIGSCWLRYSVTGPVSYLILAEYRGVSTFILRLCISRCDRLAWRRAGGSFECGCR
jgi:uncharacterized membrane protein